MIGQLLCSIGLHRWTFYTALSGTSMFSDRVCLRCRRVERRVWADAVPGSPSMWMEISEWETQWGDHFIKEAKS